MESRLDLISTQLEQTERERDHLRQALFAAVGEQQAQGKRQAEMELERSEMAAAMVAHGVRQQPKVTQLEYRLRVPSVNGVPLR